MAKIVEAFTAGWIAGFQEALLPDEHPDQDRCAVAYDEFLKDHPAAAVREGRVLPSLQEESALIEALAAWDHDAWAGWMRHVWSKCAGESVTGGIFIPAEWRDRWERQMNTAYELLSEAEKESDRKEARAILAVIKEALDGRRSEPEAFLPEAMADRLAEKIVKSESGGAGSRSPLLDLLAQWTDELQHIAGAPKAPSGYVDTEDYRIGRWNQLRLNIAQLRAALPLSPRGQD